MEKYSSVIASRQRATKLGLTEHFTDAEWESLLSNHDHCLRCGDLFGDAVTPTADHVLPLACGGSNTIDNIQPLCRQCNELKSVRHIDYRIGGTEYACPKPLRLPPSPPMSKKKRSYTLTDEADRLLDLMADKMGVSKTAILEIAIREKAAQMNISDNPPPETRQS